MCMGELLDEDSFFLRKDLPLVCELTMLEDWEILNKKVPSKVREYPNDANEILLVSLEKSTYLAWI